MADIPQWKLNKIERNKQYAKDYRRVILSLNYATELEIIEFLESLPNKQGYIKSLIEDDMRLSQRKRIKKQE